MRTLMSFILFLNATAMLWGQNVLLSKEVPIAGRHEVLFDVQVLGFYQLAVKSGLGVTVQIIDRMAGPMRIDGQVGVRDGRLDLILDKGSYKVVLVGPKDIPGEAHFKVEAIPEATVALEELKPLSLIQTQLNDHEQRSFWIVVPEGEEFALEIMGRNLIDAKIWLQGFWQVAANPESRQREPVKGQPMAYLEFTQPLPPGQYLVTCYGGPEQLWSDNTSEHPLYLRRGIPTYGSNGYHKLEVSPFGEDFLRVPDQVGYVEIRRKEKLYTKVMVSSYMPGQTRSRWEGVGSWIYKDRDLSEANVTPPTSAGSGYLVSIEAEPGAQVELAYFSKSAKTLELKGKSLVGIQPALARRDSLEATGRLVSRTQAYGQSAVPLGIAQPLARRTNLLNDLSLHVEVLDEGLYKIAELASSAASGLYKFTPVVESKGPGYKEPDFKSASEPILLTRGIFKLQISPNTQGLLDFTVTHEKAMAPTAVIAPDQLNQSLLWIVDGNEEVWVSDYNDCGSPYGLFGRSLPADLNDPLPLSLAPGGSLTLPIVSQASTLFIEGDPVDVTMDGWPLKSGQVLGQGEHALTLRNLDKRHQQFMIYTRPASTAPAPVPSAQWTDLADTLTQLKAGETTFADYQSSVPQVYLFEVPNPGLYRFETTGRLATSVYIRTRTNPNLFQATKNGIGRNGLVQQYLRPGDYLVTAVSEGKSAGRAGLVLRQTELLKGETLLPDVPRSVSLNPDAAIQFPLQISEAGLYRIQTTGLNKAFQTRLESPDGFPLLNLFSEPQEVELEPGVYTLFSLSEPIASRRVISVTRQGARPTPEGKGPFALAFNQPFNMTWRTGAPDVYQLSVPAEVEGSFQLSKGMIAELTDSAGTSWTVLGGVNWAGHLTKGELNLQVRRSDEDDFYPYSLSFATTTLLTNAAQTLQEFPANLHVSLGEPGLVDLRSSGGLDLRAKLFDKDGREIASNDDATNDWNFQISGNLPAGDYRLQVEKRSSNDGSSTMSLLARPTEQIESKTLPFEESYQPGQRVLKIPFSQAQAGAVKFSATGGDHVALALLKNDLTIGEGDNQILAALDPGDYVLMVWYPRAQEAPLKLNGLQLNVAEHTLSTKTDLAPQTCWKLSDSQHRGWSVSAETVWFTSRTGSTFELVQGHQINVFQGEGWLVSEQPTSIEPLRLKLGDSLSLAEPSEPLNIALQSDSEGPGLVWLKAAAQQPAAMISDADASGYTWETQVRNPSGTLVAVPGRGSYELRLWPLDLDHQTGNIELTSRTFTSVAPQAFGPKEGVLAADQVLAFALEPSNSSVDLILSKGMVALFAQSDKPYALRHAEQANLSCQVSNRGGTLFLLNPSDAETSWRIGSAPALESAIDPGQGYEQVCDQQTQLSLSLLASEQPVYVRGENLSLQWFGTDGSYRESRDELSLSGAAGQLQISCKQGYVRLWSAPHAEKESRFCGSVTASSEPWQMGPQRLNQASARPLVVSEKAWFRSSASGASLLALLKEGQVLDHSASTLGPQLGRLLEPGTYQLMWRPLQGGASSQTLDLELLGPQALANAAELDWRLIRTGESQVWSFSVKEKSRVGVGAEVDGDRIEASLYDHQNHLLGKGPYLLRDLEPGNYLVSFQAWGGPVRFKPLLYGADGPISQVPPEVVESYLVAPVPTDPPPSESEGENQEYSEGSDDEGGD